MDRIRECDERDLNELLLLYTQLHDNPLPEKNQSLQKLWNRIIADDNHHIIVAEQDEKIVSSCVVIIIPNLTHSQRPYAVVENVITHSDYRKQGFATKCLAYARKIAVRENCYKMMLLTGSKQESTFRFYERAGYNRQDKTAFIQWLDS